MSLYEDTKKSYYSALANKLVEGNQMFTVQFRNGGCYSGKTSHRNGFNNFDKFATSEAQKLKSVSGNIVAIDESVFDGFPKVRPPTCVPLEATCKIINGIKTCDWTRNWYWAEKKEDYARIKKEIDDKLLVLKQQEEQKVKKIAIEVKKQEDVKKLSGIGITAILAFIALKK